MRDRIVKDLNDLVPEMPNMIGRIYVMQPKRFKRLKWNSLSHQEKGYRRKCMNEARAIANLRKLDEAAKEVTI